MRILITGAGGFIGKELVNFLSSQDPSLQIRAVIRGDCPKPLYSVEYINIANISSQTDWQNALQDIDIVVHLAARVHIMKDGDKNSLGLYREINVANTLHLAEQAAHFGVKRFIYLSSIKVNGEETTAGQLLNEESLAQPKDSYAISKFEAELGLQIISKNMGIEYVIIRPPLIYGPGVKANFRKLMQLIFLRVPLPFGKIDNLRSILALGNLVDFIHNCIWHPFAANQVFVLADNEGISTTELLTHLAGAMGIKVILLPFSPKLLSKIGQLLPINASMQRLLGSLQIDSSKAKKLLGWQPRLTFEQSLKIVANDFLMKKLK